MLCTNTDMDKLWMCSGCLLLPGNLRVRVRMIWLGLGLVVRVRVKLGLGFGMHSLYGQTMDCAG